MNSKIKEYQTKKGTKYQFQIYTGMNSKTGSSKYIRKRGFENYEDAEREFNRISEQIKKGLYNSENEKRYKVKDLVNKFMKYYIEEVEQSTFYSTSKLINNHIIPLLGNFYLDAITPDKCQEVAFEWKKKAPKSFKKFAMYTKKIFEYGNSLHIMETNPMKDAWKFLPKVDREVKEFTDFYSKEELKTFLNACEDNGDFKIYAYFRLLAYTGMRKEESLALTWENVNFDENTISIKQALKAGIDNKAYIGSTKTISSSRTIPVDPQTMGILRRWQQVQRKDLFKIGFNHATYIFSNINNEPYALSQPYKWNNRITKKYKLRKIKIHGFRHTHASLLFEAGAKMQDVKDRLGHSDISTTMNIYTHVTKAKRQESAEMFANFMEM